MSATTPMLSAQDVARYFDVSKPLIQRMIAREGKRTLRAVDGLSFDIPKGTTLSLLPFPMTRTYPASLLYRSRVRLVSSETRTPVA